MRKLLLICTIVAFASGGAHALPSKPYVGLFADAAHSIEAVSNPGGFFPFMLWIWWLPSEHGLMASEFMMTYPSNVIAGTVIANPLLSVSLGCIGYVCPTFVECQVDWVWTHQQACYLTDALPSVIEIGPRPGASVIEAANCDPGYPLETVVVYNKFALNRDAVIGVESQSWGAIKSLYR